MKLMHCIKNKNLLALSPNALALHYLLLLYKNPRLSNIWMSWTIGFLSYWKANQLRYLDLAFMTLIFLSILVSTVKYKSIPDGLGYIACNSQTISLHVVVTCDYCPLDKKHVMLFDRHYRLECIRWLCTSGLKVRQLSRYQPVPCCC